MRPTRAQLAQPGLHVIGPQRITFQFAPRGYATFGATPHAPAAGPSGLFSSGLEGFRVGAAMSAATLSAFTAVQSLAGMGVPWVDVFNLAYSLTSRKARPATQAVTTTVNGRTFTTQRLVRSIY